ncbi:PREDICTED: fermitin family homolog 1-like [Amphimedon queenslandica]|uniref:FERM domain-containing protein n=2 Tax=Amphimedon queenslandica TaxID=400682 RepID=A0AAN0IWC8_AMPQE|nr:PREDICTED: fermitin family homolog 1-like [Amphimedon queenslandica]|eukprot:XP_019848741.1 PREDICTED: fermitin family homolog 1-like [Amphimedon queenslandica]
MAVSFRLTREDSPTSFFNSWIFSPSIILSAGLCLVTSKRPVGDACLRIKEELVCRCGSNPATPCREQRAPPSVSLFDFLQFLSFGVGAIIAMSFRLTVEYEPDRSPGDDTASFIMEISRMSKLSEISHSIYKHIESNLRQPEDQYALYWTENKMWLTADRPIGRLLRGVRSASVQYRRRLNPYKLRFLDASSKIVILDESQPVKDLVNSICKQLTLGHPEEVSLVVAVDYAITKHHPAVKQDIAKSPIIAGRKDLTLHTSLSDTSSSSLSPKARRKFVRPASADVTQPVSGSERPGSGKLRRKSQIVAISKKKQLSKKYQIRIDTPWLDPSKTLTEQEVSPQDELILMYRYYYHMDLEKESKETEMLYKQARAMFLAGEMMSSSELIPKFIALLCQITKGDFVSKEETQDILTKLKRLLVPPKYKPKNIAKDVSLYYKLLKGLSANDGKCWFIKLWSTCHLFGMEFFSCSNTEIKEKGLVGISKEKILFLHSNNKKKNKDWDMSSLTHWEQDEIGDIVTLFFGDERLKVQVQDYSSVLVDCLKGHQELRESFPPALYQLGQQEYQFSDAGSLSSEFKKYFNIAETKRGHKRAGSLTYSEVCFADKITENPLVSPEEEEVLQKEEMWENPAFENLDQLMEERFSFLDFDEDVTEEQPPGSDSPLDGIKLEVPPKVTIRTAGSTGGAPHHYPSPLLRASTSSTKQRTSSGSSSSDDS